MTKKVAIIFLKLAFVCAAFFWIFSKINLSLLWKNIESVDPYPLFLAYLMLHISLFFSAFRSRFYFAEFGLKLRRTFCVALYYVGTMFNIILPGGVSGDAYKVYLIGKRAKVSKLIALRIVFYERVNGVTALIFIGLMFALYSSVVNFVPNGYISLLMLLCIPCYAVTAIYLLRDKYQTVLGALKYSFMVQVFQVFSAFFLLWALIPGAEYSVYIDFIVLFIVASIASIIPISIGGAGLRELTFFYGINLLCTPTTQETGIAFALLTFVLYVLTAVIGIPIFMYMKGIKHFK